MKVYILKNRYGFEITKTKVKFEIRYVFKKLLKIFQNLFSSWVFIIKRIIQNQSPHAYCLPRTYEFIIICIKVFHINYSKYF